MRGATRDANALRKHRKAFARYGIKHTKRSQDAALCFQEMPVPQLFLSSSQDTHRNDREFGWIAAATKNGVSWTLSRKFWQQKYFLKNLLFARSPLATANFLEVFAKPIRKTDSGHETFSKPAR